MKKRLSRILMMLTLCLVGVIMIATSAITVSAAEATTPVAEEATVLYSGTCGTNLTWQIDDTGTLTIDGSGSMETYTYGSAPWYSYRAQVKKIVVGNNITRITDGAFYGMSSLEELSVPFVGRNQTIYKGSSYSTDDSYKHYPLGYIFGTSSYSGGSYTRQYYSYDYLNSYNEYVTAESSYSTYYIPSTLKKVNVTNSKYIFSGSFSFYNSSSYSPLSITEITLNEGITHIGSYAFSCINDNTGLKLVSNLETINLPSTLSWISKYSFYNCGKLDSIEIPDSVTRIENYAFYNCSSLITTIGSGVTSIGDYAFYGCAALPEINISNKVTAIGSNAFNGCSNIQKITIEEGVKTIGSFAFKGISKVKTLTIPTTVTSMGEGIFSGMSSLEELSIPFVGNNQSIHKGSSYDSSYTHYPLGYMFGTSSYSGGNYVRQYYSHDYLNSSGVFVAHRSSLSTYYIPSTLKKVNVTNSKYIFSGAFSFYNGSSTNYTPLNITEITLNEGIVYIGSSAFSCENENTSRNLVSNLETINLPSTLKWISEYSFYNCGKLNYIEIPDSVTKIENYAFYKCSSLETAIGNNVVTIGDYAFYGCTSLDNQTFKEATTTIGDYAFYGCTSFTEINIPKNITSIGNYAFAGCSNVEKIAIEEGLKTVGSYAFKGINKVTTLTIPTTVTSMGEGLFSGMAALEELSIPFVGSSQNIYKGNSYSSDSYYTHYPLGYMFGSSNYTGGIQVRQYYSYDYLNNSNEFVPIVASSTYYYIPSTLKKLNVTNSKYIFSGAFSFYNGSSTSYKPLNITDITLNEGITHIGIRAFACENENTSLNLVSNLETINLPTTLKWISEYSFYNCGKLDYIEIPSSVDKIGDYAFYKCYSLTTSIGSGVTSIGNYAFYGCTSLDNQTFKEATTAIGDYAFYGCTSFTEINIPKNITSIGNYAFAGCSNVEKIAIEEGLKTVGSYAFKGINKVTTLTIPTTVTSMGEGLFSGMAALEELSIPFVGRSQAIYKGSGYSSDSSYTHYPLGYMFGSLSYTGGNQVRQYYSYDYLNNSGAFVPYIASSTTYYVPSTLKKVTVTNSKYIFSGAFSFYNSSSTSYKPLNIADITLNEGISYIGSHAFSFENENSRLNITSKLETVNLPSTLVGICEYAFYNCGKLDYVEIPGSVTKVENYAFYNCKALTINVLKKSTELTTYTYTFNGVPVVKYFDYYSYTNGNNTFYYNVIDNEAIIAKTVTTNTDLTLPTTLGGYTVTKVANMGAANCTTLTQINIPANIIELGDYAFSGCTGLTTVTIPSTCLHVGDYAFNGCYNIRTTTLAEGVLYVGDYAFFNCKNLESIVVPDTCEYLGEGAFYNCVKLRSATIGITVPEIKDNTFMNCSSMETIVIGLKVTSIGNYAFKNCSSIKAITLKNGVLTIGDGAFMNCTSITKANLGATITDIGSYAFYGCSSLTSVTVPKLITVIHESTFEGCTALATASYNGTVSKIENKAFYGTSLTTFNFKAGLEHLGSESFSHTQLTSVTLPDSLKVIGQHVFDECELQSVSIPSCVKLDDNCKRIFANNGNNMIVTIRFVNDGVLDDYLLYCSNAKQVIISEGITDIGDYAFAKNTFAEIVLPSTLVHVGDYSFYLCEFLEEVTLPKNTKTIGNYAFAKNFNLKNIYIPDTMESIGTSAFYKVEKEEVHELLTVHIYFNAGKICKSLLSTQHMQYVIVQNGVLEIEDSVFAQCPNLREVYVGDDVSIIGNTVFANSPKLQIVYVGDGVSSFGNNNFLNDKNITLEIRMVDGYIDDYVYYDNLLFVTTVIIKDEITAIGKYAFYNDTSLKVISVPDTVNYIGEYAFYNCNSIKEINIPYGVSAIYPFTFFGCASLESITTPNTVKSIGDSAFYGCVEAKSLIISNTCESIGSNAFYNCKSIEELIIPDSVKTIDTYAFRSCLKITELIFSDNVDKIGACAFYDCNALQTVKLGKKIIELGDRMFYGCVNLKSLYVYAPLSYIDELAFYGADYVTVYCGRDDYMINFFEENFIEYVILDDLVYQYKITFVTDNGEIISSGTYDSGSTITAPTNPTKSADNTYTYVFAGWDQEVTIVGGNKTYTASFTPVYIEYTVEFKDYNGNTISSGTYHYGDEVTLPSDPTRAADNTYTYAFSGWNNEVVACAGDTIYTATYTPTYIEYTVVFKDYNGDILGTVTLHYGDSVTAPANPTRAADVVGTYSFAGWDKAVVACAGNTEYTATYEISYIDYTVTFKDYNGAVISTETYHYGDDVVVPSDPTKAADNTYTYAFAGWDKDVAYKCNGNKEYTATYAPTYIEYTVVFKDYNGDVISSKEYHYGDTVTVPSDPTRAADNTYTYAFAGWNTPISTTCDGNKEYKATYTPTYIEYTVVFEDYNGDIISTEKYHYGDSVTAPTAPTRESDVVGSYTFKAWDKAVVACAGNTTYTATYDISYTNYTVVFKNYNGDVLSTETYHYGETVIVPSAPSKPADETYTYAFIGWDKTVTTCEGDAIYTAKFAPTNVEYTVVFKNADGTVISTNTYYYGATVVIPSNPTKAADNTYTYTFAGWDKEVVDCVADATYIATYTPVYINYTITFTDYDGKEIKTVTYHYGETIVAIADPTRESDETYTYTFNGWDKPIGACKGNATFKATYTSTYIDYTVIFENEDGTVLSRETYHYGDKIVAPGTPSKASNNTYTYTFAGWDKSVGNCTGEATFTATYNANYINYTVIFKNEDGKVLSTKTYHYGEKVTEPATPTKAADNTYTYTFKAWDKTVVDCAGDVIYTATYDANYINYTVIFENADGTVLSTNVYHYGDKVTEPATPTKTADNTYTYTFKAWDKIVVDCAGDVTYTATYDANYINYTVIFKDEDGTVLSTKTCHYGEKVTEPATPTKAADNTYTYTFAGWDKAVVACDGDEVYTATYTPAYIEYTVVFKDWNGNEISRKEYHYGQAVTKPSNPTRAADNTYTYTFTGWDKTVTNCTESMVYTATYNSTYIDYEIVFKNYDGGILSSETYHYGDAVVVPETPTKPADESYTYGFAGWDSEVTACLGNKTYTATFNPTNVEYTVVFKDWNGNIISSETYYFGAEVVVPENPTRNADNIYTYTFKNWGKTVAENCVGDAEYTAVYEATYIEYNIKFLDWDGTLIQTVKYHYGDTITAIADPERESDETYTYTFLSWNKALGTCTGNASFTAQYESTYINYTVVFKDYDGSVISRKTYHFGDPITIPADPVRASDDTYSYTFKNWGNISTSCNGNKEYTAVYKEEYIDYTVIFNNPDGSVISAQTYHFGDTVTEPQNPTRAADNTYTYTFAGWNKTVVACDGDATYTATYTPTFIDYTVEFKDYDGEVISTGTYHYGDAITVPTAPTRESDAIGSYTFKAWNNTVVNCAGDATYTATYEITYTDYTVIFKDEDGTVLSTNTYHYGDEVTVPATPTKAADTTYTYTFKAWDAEVVNCAGDATYTATYDSAYIGYTVIFKNEDGTVLSTNTYHYGDEVTVPSTPTKDADNTYTYTFKAWDAEVVACAGDATYTATYDSAYIDYTVIFKNEDGTVLSTNTYHYGDEVTAPSNPTKESDGEYTYTFNGWDKEIVVCAGDATYNATYTATEIEDTTTPGTDTEPNEPGTDANDPSDNNTNDENDGLSGGAIAGIATGSTVAAGAGGFSLFWFVIKKKRFSDLLKVFKKK